jgi:hypothetical protein
MFSERRRIERHDGSHTYLCPLCDERLASAHRAARLTDDQLCRLIEAGSLAMIAGPGAGSGIGPSGLPGPF